MNTYTPPDKIEIYAAALQSDIGAGACSTYRAGEIMTYWHRAARLLRGRLREAEGGRIWPEHRSAPAWGQGSAP